VLQILEKHWQTDKQLNNWTDLEADPKTFTFRFTLEPIS
jgi:hypothetical protein